MLTQAGGEKGKGNVKFPEKDPCRDAAAVLAALAVLAVGPDCSRLPLDDNPAMIQSLGTDIEP